MNSRKSHWEQIYATKPSDSVSWYQSHPSISLGLIAQAGVPTNAAVIDIGGGDSLLVDHLLDLNYSNVTVLDISGAALERAQKRLSDRADQVVWIERDITEFVPSERYDLWHDRAVFHFLTDPEDQQIYREVKLASTHGNSQSIISTFSKNGPGKCSGLDVAQYDITGLQQCFAPEWNVKMHLEHKHTTPSRAIQPFVFGLFGR